MTSLLTIEKVRIKKYPAIDIACRWIGENKPNKPLLIFLHEGLGCIAMWKDFPELLCEATKLSGLVYDRQGYGLSSSFTEKRTPSYLHDYALKELPLLISKLEINQEVILIGHSDGGTIALLYASQCPENVKAVITEAAHVFVEDITLKGIYPVVNYYEASPEYIHNKLAKYHKEKTNEVFYAWADIWRDPSFRDWNIEKEIKSVECPVLSIQGIQDEYGTEKQVDSIIEHISGKGEKQMVDNCKHTPHKDQKEKVLELMRTFICKHI